MSKSWLDYGFRCVDLYRRSREKIPVFPIEWLVVENVRNMERVKVDADGKAKIRDVFIHKVLKDEKRNREAIEREGLIPG